MLEVRTVASLSTICALYPLPNTTMPLESTAMVCGGKVPTLIEVQLAPVISSTRTTLGAVGHINLAGRIDHDAGE